jgi:hypothetical protein
MSVSHNQTAVHEHTFFAPTIEDRIIEGIINHIIAVMLIQYQNDKLKAIYTKKKKNVYNVNM